MFCKAKVIIYSLLTESILDSSSATISRLESTSLNYETDDP